ncbi:MAG: chromate resistance protein ChrB domain-containing protein [Methylobacter sp.]
MSWIIMIMSLPSDNTTTRMRVWRAVKASGAAVLRDGVYLLPERDNCRLSFEAIAADVQSGGGSASLMRVEALDGNDFSGLFDRHEAYALLLTEVDKAVATLVVGNNAQDAFKQLRKLRKTFAGLVEIDFFPGEAQKQVDTALLELELKANRILAPDEPHAIDAAVPNLSVVDYQAQLWATRRRPWVDRLASAWLIRRFIDPQARFVWLDSIADCPADALGFDFDGAAFSHIGALVTFEVLLASFALDHPGLKRLGLLVHYLDVGGIQPPEAVGIETVLAGLRDTVGDDDRLLVSAGAVFDSLLAAFEKGETSDGPT